METPGKGRFNSKLVRLKAKLSICKSVAYSFQFQTGAIKRNAGSTLITHSLWGFHSKLVRLKVEIGHVCGPACNYGVLIPNWCD